MSSDFRAQLDAAYEKKVVQRGEEAVRFTGLSLITHLKNDTPVDTGRARANWHIDLNVVDVRLVEPNEGLSPDAVATVVARYKMGGVIYISNNLPYIRRLNDGYSQQAPAGFVDDDIIRAKNDTMQRFK